METYAIVITQRRAQVDRDIMPKDPLRELIGQHCWGAGQNFAFLIHNAGKEILLSATCESRP